MLAHKLGRLGLALGVVALWVVTSLAGTGWAAGGGGGGPGDEWANKPMAFRDGFQAITSKDYAKAIQVFSQFVARDATDADAFNFLGYSYRKSKDYDNAIKNYKKALELDPKHLGAHEYLGEAYLELGDLAKAKELLANLDKICWMGCKEYRELRDEVKEYEASHKS